MSEKNTLLKCSLSEYSILPSVRLYVVVLSIGVSSLFLVSLDSVADNLLPSALPFLQGIYSTREDADVAWECIVSSRTYGIAVGCFLSMFLPNAWGRKKPLVAAIVLNILGGLMCMLTVYIKYGVYAAIAGRFINGCGSGLIQVVGSAMLTEISPIHSRGTALATLTVWACVGELTGLAISLDEILGNENTWHIALSLPVCLLPLALICLWFAPDSPRSLVMENRIEEAMIALHFYQHPSEWQTTLDDIMSECASEKAKFPKSAADVEEICLPPKCPHLSVRLSRFRSGKFVRPLLIAGVVQTFVHLNDWLWILYSTQVFENEGLTAPAAKRASLLMSIPQAIVSLALLFCFHRFSRRWLLIIPTLGSVFCSVLATAVIQTPNVEAYGPFKRAYLIPAFASLDLVLAAMAGESAYTVVPELFAHSDRVVGTATAGISQNFAGAVLSTFLLSTINIYGTHYVLVPFMMINSLYVLFVYNFLPETAGKTFHSISAAFSSELPIAFVWIFAHFVAPLRKFVRIVFVSISKSLSDPFAAFAQLVLCILCLHFLFQSLNTWYFLK